MYSNIKFTEFYHWTVVMLGEYLFLGKTHKSIYIYSIYAHTHKFRQHAWAHNDNAKRMLTIGESG